MVKRESTDGLTADVRREWRCRAALGLPMLQDELDEIETGQRKEIGPPKPAAIPTYTRA